MPIVPGGSRRLCPADRTSRGTPLDRYPRGVTNDDMTQKHVGPGVRRVAALMLGAVLGSVAAPAAAVPSTWENSDNPSIGSVLLWIGGPVIAIIAILALLTYLPSMIRGSGPGELAYNDPEWFGGPRTGLKTDAETTPGTGGSGGRW